jgi:hypothetical protein
VQKLGPLVCLSLVVFAAMSVVRYLTGWPDDVSALVGAAVAGVIAGALTDWRTGIEAAGTYLVVLTALGVLAFMAGYPADHS